MKVAEKMMCLLSSSFLASNFKEDSAATAAQQVASPPAAADEETSKEVQNNTVVCDKEMDNVQLPPTPPTTQGDCDEFVPKPETKKDVCEESPLKGYRRVLARNGSRWVLQFVSPEGLRFDSQDELASHVCQKRPDMDPGDWKKLDMHFLRHSMDEQKVQKVQFTFCSMRQNIFDLKRKRGKKRDIRRNSIAVIPCRQQPEMVQEAQVSEYSEVQFKKPALELLPDTTKEKEETTTAIKQEESPILHSETPIIQPEVQSSRQVCAKPVQRAESCDESLLINCHNSTQEPTETDAIVKEEKFLERPASCSLAEVMSILDKDVEVQMVSREEVPGVNACSVSVCDLFQHTPLSKYDCLGCGQTYCGKTDEFTIDLKCQTMSVVCSNCLWWTSRRVSARLKTLQ